MQLIVNVPDRYLINTNAEELVGQFKLYTALLMFQTGRLSAGAACEFAGVDRYVFLAACKRHHINAIDYDETELEADFDNLKKSRSAHADNR